MIRLRHLLGLCLLVFVLASCGGGGGASYTGEDVIAAFKAAGLEAENAQTMTQDDYGLAPYVGTGTHFTIPSLCATCGGRVIITDNDTDTEALRTYYEELGQSSAALFSWVAVRDNVVLQINGELPEEEFRKYEDALNGLE